MASRSRSVAGWIAVAISTFFSALWAFWGSIENFHEGWYYHQLWRNLGLMVIQYIPWMFIPMSTALLALWRRWLGVALHVALAFGVLWRFGVHPAAALTLIATPLLALAALYGYGQPTPVAWARRVVVWIPLATAIVSGAYPGWRAITRPSTVDLSLYHITANGVDLVWAPAGPGWADRGFSWFEARSRCEHLTADGTALAPTPQNVWRLPSVDEAVRTMVWRGHNAGGVWDASTRQATYREMPDKDAPLWNRYSMVIYWWTSDEADASRAYRVVYNGQVGAVPKAWRPGYLACRCVRSF
jgi:hypothetical protein